jgi:ferrous iron transport protein B
MGIKIALAGNPNTGKTTLFNALTGANQYVGNWPGVTVEKKEGKLKKHNDVIVTDLPGIYSLSPYTLEEVVARNYLLNEKPDAILNIIDGTNLERNLYLTTQLIELGIPTVVAVNMADVIARNGEKLNLEALSSYIGCPVVEISALKGIGVEEAANKAVSIANSGIKPNVQHGFDGRVEKALTDLSEQVLENTDSELRRWYAIKLFERDQKVLERLNISADTLATVENIIAEVEKDLDDDAESIITTDRYNYIATIIDSCYTKRNKQKLSLSDKIDQIVTNRIFALPIFVAIMFLVYYVSISTIGTGMTDWVNDVAFGENGIPMYVESALTSLGTADWLSGLIKDGIVAGVGAVLGFLPQLVVLFIFLAFLEGCGYMARIAFILDRIFKKFGLSGKSFIPILIGTGCSVPGIMASRTIENDKDRRMTIMTTSFMPCSAKLPIIALIAGALFNGEWWVAPSAYFVGIVAILFSGIVLKKTFMFAGDTTPFVIELPAYHMPTIGNLARSVWERASSFVKKAGSVILLATVLIWTLSHFGFVDGAFSMLEDEQLDQSILALIGHSFAWLFTPLGWGQWRAAVAAVSGLVAKENIVGTFGILYGFADAGEDGAAIWSNLQASFTPAAAYGFLVFNLLCAPCFAAIGAMKREMNSAKWTWFALGYQCIFAYVVALIIYQIGSVITGEGLNIIGLIVAVILIVVLLYFFFRPNKFDNTKNSVSSVKANY